MLRPTVLAEIPHDPSADTEGLELDGSTLYESTGGIARSQLRELDPSTGALRRVVSLPAAYFGEGITVVGTRIWQLTYRNGIAIEWDKDTLARLREVPFEGERGLGTLLRRQSAGAQRRQWSVDFSRPGGLH